MLIYEKDNKLNINFENSVDGEPDLQIGKDGDKTKILVDGQESGGGSNAPLICTDTGGTLDKTMGEIQAAFFSGRLVIRYEGEGYSALIPTAFTPVYFSPKTDSYLGDVTIGVVDYRVDESTEEAALAAYPTFNF